MVQKFYEKEGINLKNDELAMEKVHTYVRIQIYASKKYPMTIYVPYVIDTDDMSKSLYVQINSVNDLEYSSKKSDNKIQNINGYMDEEKTINIFQQENKAGKIQKTFTHEEIIQNDLKENDDSKYDRKVTEYVIQEFNVKEGIDLKNDEIALNRVYSEVKKQLSLSKEYPIIIDIPYIMVTNDGPKSLYVKLSKEIIQSIKQSRKQTPHIIESQSTEIKKELEPLQIKCPYCNETAYLQFSHGYVCVKCNRVHLTVENDVTLQLKDLCKQAFLQQGSSHEKRLSLLKQMESLDPEQAQLIYWIGAEYGCLGFKDKQFQCYQKALKIDSRDALFYRGLGLFEYNSKNYEKVIEYYKKAQPLYMKGYYSSFLSFDIFAEYYCISLERTGESEAAHHVLLEMKRFGYEVSKCRQLINDYNIGKKFIGRNIRRIFEKYRRQISWGRRDIIERPFNEEITKTFHISYKADFYIDFSSSSYFIKNMLKQENKSKEGMVITDYGLYCSAKVNRAAKYYYLSYLDLSDSRISYTKNNIILEFSLNAGDSVAYEINIGVNAPVVYKILTEIQELYRE